MPEFAIRSVCAAILLSALLSPHSVSAAGPEPYDPWPGLVQDIFDSRPMEDGSNLIALEMPP
jgi:sulfur-oxidizing protein SoxY